MYDDDYSYHALSPIKHKMLNQQMHSYYFYYYLLLLVILMVI
jgi:hypothetical protein